jgi:hypothetical protein
VLPSASTLASEQLLQPTTACGVPLYDDVVDVSTAGCTRCHSFLVLEFTRWAGEGAGISARAAWKGGEWVLIKVQARAWSSRKNSQAAKASLRELW